MNATWIDLMQYAWKSGQTQLWVQLYYEAVAELSKNMHTP